MSARLVSAVWEYSSHSRGELLVLLALADNADTDTGQCFPSVRYLAEKTRLTRRAVQYAIRSLEQSGEVEIITPGNWSPDGKGRPHTYRINEENLRQRRGAQHLRSLSSIAP